MRLFDYLVVGSGCSGAMAAQTLVDGGAQVTMIDAGFRQNKDFNIPNKDFLTIRKNEPEQYKYLIGDAAEGVSWGKVGKGEQVTPPRKYLMDKVEKYIPTISSSFSTMESLGYGGLGIGWGLQCWEYSKDDLEAAGLDQTAMSKAYQVVADRIGISATKDDASAYTLGSLKTDYASPRMDRNHQLIYKKYQARQDSYNKKGLFMGRTPLALITKDSGHRKKYAYNDMDFYSDHNLSVWRPWITVNQLKKKPNFEYVDGLLVLSFKEKTGYTEVSCLDLANHKEVKLRCRKLVLATSALGSARVVLRSLSKAGTKLPLLCNPYTYIPCLQPRFVGQAAESKKLGFTQLSLFLDKDHTNRQTSVASLYSYQSLMLFRLIKQVPLSYNDARIIMQYLSTGIVIMGVHHPDQQTSAKYVSLLKSEGSPTGDVLNIAYGLSSDERAEINSREKVLIKAMRRMGAFSLKKIDPGYGSSIHYAGTLPFSQTPKPLHLNYDGRLHGTKTIYVADSSGFKYLPAPGLTFSLMANAHLVAENLLKNV